MENRDKILLIPTCGLCFTIDTAKLRLVIHVSLQNATLLLGLTIWLHYTVWYGVFQGSDSTQLSICLIMITYELTLYTKVLYTSP